MTTPNPQSSEVEALLEELSYGGRKNHLDDTLGMDSAREILRTTFTQQHNARMREVIHEWNKAELKLDGTAQGAINCIEHYRNYLSNFPTNPDTK